VTSGGIIEPLGARAFCDVRRDTLAFRGKSILLFQEGKFSL
jgi:hypothetical protein